MAIDPRVFADTPFRNRTAANDFAGTFFLYHVALAHQIFVKNGKTVKLLPIGDGFGGPDWLTSVQQQHQAEASALGIAGPPDLSSFDLKSRDDWASFMWLISQDLLRLRNAAGLS